MKLELGQKVFGVNLKAANAKLAIVSGVLMQKTITAAGRVSYILRIKTDQPVMSYDSSLCFDTENAAKDFYVKNNQEYKSIDTDVLKPAYAKADSIRELILGTPLFPELADKQ